MFFRYTLFPFIWAIIILILTLMPGGNMPKMGYFPGLDKLVHAFVFAVQSFLLIVGFAKQYTYAYVRENQVRLALILSIGYGVLIEVVQGFIPGRSFEVPDIAADAAGAFIGWAAFLLIYKVDF